MFTNTWFVDVVHGFWSAMRYTQYWRNLFTFGSRSWTLLFFLFVNRWLEIPHLFVNLSTQFEQPEKVSHFGGFSSFKMSLIFHINHIWLQTSPSACGMRYKLYNRRCCLGNFPIFCFSPWDFDVFCFLELQIPDFAASSSLILGICQFLTVWIERPFFSSHINFSWGVVLCSYSGSNSFLVAFDNLFLVPEFFAVSGVGPGVAFKKVFLAFLRKKTSWVRTMVYWGVPHVGIYEQFQFLFRHFVQHLKDFNSQPAIKALEFCGLIIEMPKKMQISKPLQNIWHKGHLHSFWLHRSLRCDRIQARRNLRKIHRWLVQTPFCGTPDGKTKTISLSQKRVLLTKWLGEAWEKMCKENQIRSHAFKREKWRAGLTAINGSGNQWFRKSQDQTSTLQ